MNLLICSRSLIWLVCIFMHSSFNCHEWSKWSHWTHSSCMITFKYLILMIFHHLIPVFSSWLSGSYRSNFLWNCVIQFFFLLLVYQFYLKVLISRYLIRIRRINFSYLCLKTWLIFATLYSLRCSRSLTWIFCFWCNRTTLYTLIQILLWVSFWWFIVFMFITTYFFAYLWPHHLVICLHFIVVWVGLLVLGWTW